MPKTGPAKTATLKKITTEKGHRRTQEDRSRTTKESLLTATIEVLIRMGYSGLTMKEVEKRSGISNGALMHHYASKAELVVAATAMVYEEAIMQLASNMLKGCSDLKIDDFSEFL